MMTRDYLFPELVEALLVDAESQARNRQGKRHRWRRLKLTGATLASALAFSAVAYASQDLWRPVLGSGTANAPAAAAAPPPKAFMDELAVLRRPQTNRDRSAASEAALRFPARDAEIRTGYVRRLRDTQNGGPVILVPVVDADGQDRLCLWTPDAAADATSRTCATHDEFAAGRLILASPSPTASSPEIEGELARRRREAASKGTYDYETEDLLGSSESGHVFGLAPDAARFASVGGAVMLVRDNSFEGDVRSIGDLQATWATGR